MQLLGGAGPLSSAASSGSYPPSSCSAGARGGVITICPTLVSRRGVAARVACSLSNMWATRGVQRWFRWLRGFLNRHPALSARFASTLDGQRAYANAPEASKNYFRRLRDAAVVNKYLDGKGFTPGPVNRAIQSTVPYSRLLHVTAGAQLGCRNFCSFAKGLR